MALYILLIIYKDYYVYT